jgi:hypothetical protein
MQSPEALTDLFRIHGRRSRPSGSAVADHVHYQARSVLPESVREELLDDLRGTTKPLPIG